MRSRRKKAEVSVTREKGSMGWGGCLCLVRGGCGVGWEGASIEGEGEVVAQMAPLWGSPR